MEEKMLCQLETGDKVYRQYKNIVIKFSGKRAVLSTGILNGGYSEVLTSIFNHDAKTAPGMGCQLRAPSYLEHMKIIAEEMGLNTEETTGIGTAADMENVSIVEKKYKNLSVTALVTAGIETNGGRVGDPASYIEENGKTEKLSHGTINILVAINGKLLPYTLARSMITITEAKTAAIQELLEGSKYSNGLATGSGTDGIIVYSNLEAEESYKDAGKHSKLGELIGLSVKEAVKKALEKQSGLCSEKQKSIFRRGRRYGITAENLWKYYLEKSSKRSGEKIEYLDFIEKIEKKEELVSLTSLYLHLLDQYTWELLSDHIVRRHCKLIRKEIANFLEIPLVERKAEFEKSKELIKDMIDCYLSLLFKYVKKYWE